MELQIIYHQIVIQYLDIHLQVAINAVPTDNTETVVNLLYSTSGLVEIAANKNVTLNLNGNTISTETIDNAVYKTAFFK